LHTLLLLPDDSLRCTLLLLDEDALCALGCTCQQLASLTQRWTEPWMRIAATKGVARDRATLLQLRAASRMLRIYALQPPPSTPQRLRCHWDPASAASAAQPRVGTFAEGTVAADSVAIAPFSAREAAWLAWFGRFHDGRLLLETLPCQSRARHALHLHDSTTDDCMACALPRQGGACLGVARVAIADDSEQRLVRAVGEFRHRE
jgi:hypothetical protein